MDVNTWKLKTPIWDTISKGRYWGSYHKKVFNIYDKELMYRAHEEPLQIPEGKTNNLMGTWREDSNRPFTENRGSFQVLLVVKNLPANAGAIRDSGSIPGSVRSHGEGNGNPLQYSCLENPVDRGAWWATVHRVTKSQTWLKRLSTHAHFNRKAINDWIINLIICLLSVPNSLHF